MKKIIIILIFILLISYNPQEPDAAAALLLPKAGGIITYYNPACLLPPSINIITVNGATGVGTLTTSFVWGGSFPYSYGPPAHPKQPLLGLASYVYVPCAIPCHAGVCPIGPGGFQLLYSGVGI